MIDLETRLLEILDWDEDELTRIYEKSAAFINEAKFKDTSSLRKMLKEHLVDDISEEGAGLILLIIDQNIRKESRIIEE